MSRPLNKQELQTITQALEFIEKLFDCAESIDVNGIDKKKMKKLNDCLSELSDMLDNGEIDVKSNSASVQAETDWDGIHLNDTQSIYSMPGDLMLEDCEEGYFKSLWLIIAMLFHEKYHYENHTGLWGGVIRAPFDLVWGSTALIVDDILEQRAKRTWLWKEFKAYAFSHLRMLWVGFILEDVCRKNPDCIPCCEQHLQWQRDAMNRQDPWSTYGR